MTAEGFDSAAKRSAFRRRLRRWYQQHGRQLPWRATRDPYRIWISEVMLQQTTVAAVIDYFARWFEAFPTVEALAAADEQDVLRQWEGLGYYSRARNLHKAARIVVGDFGGEFPATLAELQSLPGIGRYTAGAIASFAFDQPAPIVEANTERLYARLIGLEQATQTTAGKRQLWEFAEAVLPRKDAGDFNQALMDLGSQVCRPVDPDCRQCPVRTHCNALATGRTSSIPAPKVRAATTELTEAAVAIRRGGTLLVRQRAPGEWWEGLWDFPRVRLDDCGWLPKLSGEPQPVLPGLFSPVEEAISGLTGVAIDIDFWWREIWHGITRYRVRLLCFGGVATTNTSGSRGPDGQPLRWATDAELADLPLTRTARQLADQIASSRDGQA